MFHIRPGAGVVGKIAHLALLGMGVLILGPVALTVVLTIVALMLGVVATALPFVVIGALSYGPYVLARKALGYPPRRFTLRMRRLTPEMRPVPPPPVAARRVPPLPRPPMPREIPVRMATKSERPENQSHWRRVAARVVSEVFCGAVVGGILGVVALVGMGQDWTGHALMNYSAIGAGIGGLVGFVVGGPRPVPVEQTHTAMRTGTI